MMFTACCTTRSKARFVAGWLAIFCFAYVAASPAQTDLAAYERITTAANQSALMYVARPFHLVMNVTVPGTKGQPDRDVRVERWQDRDDSRTVLTSGATTETRLERGGKAYRLLQGDPVPDFANTALETVLHPGPFPADLAGTLPDLRKQAFGKSQLECVMLDKPMKRVAFAPLGLFPTYCLSDTNVLLVNFSAGTQTAIEDPHGRFLDHDIILGLTLMELNRVVARAKVTTLATFTPKPDEFEPTPELIASATTVPLTGAVTQGRLKTQVKPVYPASANASGITGAVILSAVIGQDGHIHSLQPVSAPDPDLALSAIVAVRQWTYTPYLLNGQPTSVRTTITVNYAR